MGRDGLGLERAGRLEGPEGIVHAPKTKVPTAQRQQRGRVLAVFARHGSEERHRLAEPAGPVVQPGEVDLDAHVVGRSPGQPLLVGPDREVVPALALIEQAKALMGPRVVGRDLNGLEELLLSFR